MIKDPMEIEQRSFAIIKQEAELENFDVKEKRVVIRVIHTTADFEYTRILKFHSSAIEKGMAALRQGCRLYTDTAMLSSGINKTRLKAAGCELVTYIGDPDIALQAKARGVTRSILGIEKAVQDRQIKIFLIGNAPTALFTLIDYIKKDEACPDLVIGVPVGFVGAAESKAQLMQCDVPWIATQGRKGGSTVAVAILHALLYQL